MSDEARETFTGRFIRLWTENWLQWLALIPAFIVAVYATAWAYEQHSVPPYVTMTMSLGFWALFIPRMTVYGNEVGVRLVGAGYRFIRRLTDAN